MCRLVTIILLLNISVAAYSQKADSVCIKFNSVTTFLADWKKNTNKLTFPLLEKRQKPKLSHPLFVNGGTFYSSAVKFEDEIISEFGIDNDGKSFFTAYVGIYKTERIDEEGKKLSQKIISCIDRAKWQIGEATEGVNYLYLTYSPVDIVVQILKRKTSQKGYSGLSLTMFRFTPVK